MIDYINLGNTKYDKALFIDRDGTIIRDTVMPFRKEDLTYFPDTFEALREACRLDAYLIIITNQSGIALGKYSELDMRNFHRLMLEELQGEGIRVNGILYCPHYDTKNFPLGYSGCNCSKPKAGLLTEAEELFGIRLEASALIGDKHTDIGAGIHAGCKANILVTTGIYKNGDYNQENLAPVYPPSYVVDNLSEAVGIAGRYLK